MVCVPAGNSPTQMCLTGHVMPVRLHLPIRDPRLITLADQVSLPIVRNTIIFRYLFGFGLIFFMQPVATRAESCALIFKK